MRDQLIQSSDRTRAPAGWAGRAGASRNLGGLGRETAVTSGALVHSCDRPLQGLMGSSVAERFRAWTGRSGRRYVFSVYPLDKERDAADDLPVGGGSVVIGVERGEDGGRTLFVAESGAVPEAFFEGGLVRDLRARRGCELHVHLTAGDGERRRAIVADLTR